MRKERRPREISSCRHSHLILDKDDKLHIREKTTSSTNGSGKTGYPYVKD
jgi:hypothetical protein